MTFHQRVRTQEFTQGGGVFSSSTSNTTETFATNDLRNFSYIELTPNTGDTTYTIFASTSWTGVGLLPNASDSRRWLFENASSTSGIDVIISGGTGVIMTTTTIGPLTGALLACFRRADTDIWCDDGTVASAPPWLNYGIMYYGKAENPQEVPLLWLWLDS